MLVYFRRDIAHIVTMESLARSAGAARGPARPDGLVRHPRHDCRSGSSASLLKDRSRRHSATCGSSRRLLVRVRHSCSGYADAVARNRLAARAADRPGRRGVRPRAGAGSGTGRIAVRRHDQRRAAARLHRERRPRGTRSCSPSRPCWRPACSSCSEIGAGERRWTGVRPCWRRSSRSSSDTR